MYPTKDCLGGLDFDESSIGKLQQQGYNKGLLEADLKNKTVLLKPPDSPAVINDILLPQMFYKIDEENIIHSCGLTKKTFQEIWKICNFRRLFNKDPFPVEFNYFLPFIMPQYYDITKDFIFTLNTGYIKKEGEIKANFKVYVNNNLIKEQSIIPSQEKIWEKQTITCPKQNINLLPINLNVSFLVPPRAEVFFYWTDLHLTF